MGNLFKSGWFWFAVLLAVAIIFLWRKGYLSTDERVISYRLPTDSDPTVFGPHYWSAIHNLVEQVPCPACRNKAVSFQKFFHDTVNHRLGKPIQFQENYDMWLTYISKLKEDQEAQKDQTPVSVTA